MTIFILALAALFSAWISPVFELPSVKTASNYLIPALFGSLTLGLFGNTSGGSLFGMIGFLILFMLPIAIIFSRIMWKKGIIQVVDNDDAVSSPIEEDILEK